MGHNLRTCITHKMSLTGNKYFRLFGVQLDLSSSSSSSASSSFVMRKSFSMDGLSNWFTLSSSSSSDLTTDGKFPQCNEFISDGVVTATRNRKRKKGELQFVSLSLSLGPNFFIFFYFYSFSFP